MTRLYIIKTYGNRKFISESSVCLFDIVMKSQNPDLLTTVTCFISRIWTEQTDFQTQIIFVKQ